MGSQRNIAKQIIEEKADYVLALKGNQGNLHNDISLYMQSIMENSLKKPFDYDRYVDSGGTDGLKRGSIGLVMMWRGLMGS